MSYLLCMTPFTSNLDALSDCLGGNVRCSCVLSPRVSHLQVQQAPQSFPPLSSYDTFAGNLDMLSGYLGGNVRYSLPSLLEFTVVKIF